MATKKAFGLKSKEFGRGPAHTKRFATLAELAAAVKDQWQGADYIDGPGGFHTDYCTFTLIGAKLADIGKTTIEVEFGFPYREFTFNDDAGEVKSAESYDYDCYS